MRGLDLTGFSGSAHSEGVSDGFESKAINSVKEHKHTEARVSGHSVASAAIRHAEMPCYFVATLEPISPTKRTPLYIVWEDGVRYKIEKVIDARPTASHKAGGAGIKVCGGNDEYYD